MKSRANWTRAALLALAISATLLGRQPADAVVFYARDEMLELAFPDADEVVTRSFIITGVQKTRLEELARSRFDSKLLTAYEGRRDGRVTGWALLDTHNVRTLPETFLVVLAPSGKVTATHMLAFHEPTEYMPPPRWLKQFDDQGLDDDLRVGRAIAGITGATLSARAVEGGIRRALATWQVLLAPGADLP